MTQTDVTLYDGGSIVLLTPETDAASEWMEMHLPDDAPTMGRAVAVERRYAHAIVEGMREAGLVVSQ